MTPEQLCKHIDRLGYETDPIRSAPLVVILDPDLPAGDDVLAVADSHETEATLAARCPNQLAARLGALGFDFYAPDSPNSSIPEDAAEPGRPYREDPIVVGRADEGGAS
jgi:hypothetical protein